MRLVTALSAATLAGLWLWRRNMRNSGPMNEIPGERKQPDTWLLEVGAKLLQDKAPLAAMNTYLDGFHFFADDMGHQMEAHHYCSQLNEDFIQAAIFDGNTPDARLIGVEYIINERLFRMLPEEERRFWHSHRYEVKSGSLVAPGIPQLAEHRLMEKIITTYGKTFHTWDTMHHDLPVGIPALMMGFVSDGQMNPRLEAERDQRMGLSATRRREARRDIPVPSPIPGADAWQSGRTVQLELSELPFREVHAGETESISASSH